MIYIPSLKACGIEWAAPTYFFNGASDLGYVDCWETASIFKLDDETIIPIIVGFSSKNAPASPIIGNGWIIPLLESRIVQRDENRYLMIQPDGRNLELHRLGDTNILEGPGGWTAEVKTSGIVARAKCGWKIEFKSGKISSILTPQNKLLDYVYENGRVTEIRTGSATRIRISYSRDIVDVLVDGNSVKLKIGLRPEIAVINGTNVVSGLQPTLVELSGSNIDEKYEFGVDEQKRPNLKIDSRDKSTRLLTWDPSTRYIVQDNEWSYDVKTLNDTPLDVCIERHGKGNSLEMWSRDNRLGEIIEQGSDGVRTKMILWRGGVKPGALRKRQRFSNGTWIDTYIAAYSERGTLLREIIGDTIIIYSKNSPNTVEEVRNADRIVYKNNKLPTKTDNKQKN